MFQEYFKKWLSQLKLLPTTLQIVQKQMTDQKELRTSVEKKVEILSKTLKTIVMKFVLLL